MWSFSTVGPHDLGHVWLMCNSRMPKSGACNRRNCLVNRRQFHQSNQRRRRLSQQTLHQAFQLLRRPRSLCSLPPAVEQKHRQPYARYRRRVAEWENCCSIWPPTIRRSHRNTDFSPRRESASFRPVTFHFSLTDTNWCSFLLQLKCLFSAVLTFVPVEALVTRVSGIHLGTGL